MGEALKDGGRGWAFWFLTSHSVSVNIRKARRSRGEGGIGKSVLDIECTQRVKQTSAHYCDVAT